MEIFVYFFRARYGIMRNCCIIVADPQCGFASGVLRLRKTPAGNEEWNDEAKNKEI
jgi:hypothetical protein